VSTLIDEIGVDSSLMATVRKKLEAWVGGVDPCPGRTQCNNPTERTRAMDGRGENERPGE